MHSPNLQIASQRSSNNTTETIVELKFPSNNSVDTFIYVNVTISRVNGKLMAMPNDSIDIYYVEHQGKTNILAIGLADSGTNTPEEEKKVWLFMDVYQNGVLIETCMVYCDINANGETSDCCQDSSGNCFGLGPHCGPPMA